MLRGSPYVGMMTQDLTATHPHAIAKDEQGYLSVRYDLLGLRRVNYAQWEKQVWHRLNYRIDKINGQIRTGRQASFWLLIHPVCSHWAKLFPYQRASFRRSSTSSTCPFTVTLRQTSVTFPLRSMIKVLRTTPMNSRPYIFFSCHTP